MKAYNSFSFASLSNLITLIVMVVLSVNTVSCTSAADDFDQLSRNGEETTITDVQVTYTYTVPEELLHYVEIYPCVNNDNGTDMLPTCVMKSPIFSHTYHVSKLNKETVFVAEFRKLLTTAQGVLVDWTICMDITINMKVNGEPIEKVYQLEYPIQGDLWQEVYNMRKNWQGCVYALTVGNKGECTLK